jgi:hypothetical protein
MVLSQFTINQVVQTLIDTHEFTIPVTSEIFESATGYELTTLLLFPIIPNLWYTFGTHDVDILITPLSTTELEFDTNSVTSIKPLI